MYIIDTYLDKDRLPVLEKKKNSAGKHRHLIRRI